jgi:Chalcone isomerase like
MHSSPLRMLVVRQVCNCSSATKTPSTNKLVSIPTRRHASYNAPIAGFGSPESLRRRHRPVAPVEPLDKAERARLVKRMKIQTYGILLCAAGIAGTIWLYSGETKPVLTAEEKDSNKKTTSFDSPNIPGLLETSLAEEAEKIPTGTSTIPFFPRTVHLSAPSPPASAAAANEAVEKDTEYQLLGLGIRTVSILSIQVYVVGLYVAVPDIAALQERLIRTIDPVATTLVPGEKDKLKQLLMDPAQGEEVWTKILRDGGIRTAFRIVPTRNTDFMHMRDGFVRGITARSAHFASDLQDQTFQDESFGQSMNDFKSVFGGGSRKRIPYGETLYLTRDAKGKFGAFSEDKKGVRLYMGEVPDERVSRLLWLNYLAGKSVSSEEARKNVVAGCIEITSRPVGTVAGQVV